MKKVFFALCVFCFGCNLISIAQCGKNLHFKGSTTEYLDASGNVTRSVDEQTVITIKGKDIAIVPGSDHNMTGTVTQTSCNWKKPYKEGKSIFNATLKDRDKTEEVVLSLEGSKTGSIYLTVKFKNNPDKIIRVVGDSFEELGK